jgi:hypothetical protein
MQRQSHVLKSGSFYQAFFGRPILTFLQIGRLLISRGADVRAAYRDYLSISHAPMNRSMLATKQTSTPCLVTHTILEVLAINSRVATDIVPPQLDPLDL